MVRAITVREPLILLGTKAYGLPAEALAKVGNPTYCMPETTPNYELAYHLDSDLEESRVAEIRADLEKFLNDRGASIAYSKEPEKTRLSYPIRHKRQSFFGYCQVYLENKEVLAELEEHIKLNGDIMRHIVLKVEPESERQKAARVIMGQREQERKMRKAQTPTAPTANPEEMEKELEKVIEKL